MVSNNPNGKWLSNNYPLIFWWFQVIFKNYWLEQIFSSWHNVFESHNFLILFSTFPPLIDSEICSYVCWARPWRPLRFIDGRGNRRRPPAFECFVLPVTTVCRAHRRAGANYTPRANLRRLGPAAELIRDLILDWSWVRDQLLHSGCDKFGHVICVETATPYFKFGLVPTVNVPPQLMKRPLVAASFLTAFCVSCPTHPSPFHPLTHPHSFQIPAHAPW